MHIITRALEHKASVTMADVVSHRGRVRSEKESPRVNWIMGKLYCKKMKVLNQEIRKL